MVEDPVQLVDRAGPERVPDLGSIERHTNRAMSFGSVVGDVRQVETRDLGPCGGIENGRDHVATVRTHRTGLELHRVGGSLNGEIARCTVCSVQAVPIVVLEVEPGHGWFDEVRLLSAALDPEEVVLALPAGRAAITGDLVDIIDAWANCGAAILTANGATAMVGLAGAIAQGDDDVAIDDDNDVFHYIDHDRDTTRYLAFDGRVRDVEVGRPVLVVVGPGVGLTQGQSGRRDLERILGYRDAVAEQTLVADQVAPELWTMPFWTPEFCETVIRAAELVDAFQHNDTDPIPGNEVSLAAISPRLFAHLEDDIAVRVMPAIKQFWPYVDYFGLRDAFVIKYSPSGQRDLRIHHDVAQVSGSVRLNDGYVGGLLAFPRQGFTNADLAVGDLLLWPSLVTHPHRAQPINSGVKYNLTLWFELPGQADSESVDRRQ